MFLVLHFFTCFVFSDFVCFRSSGRPPGVSPPGGLRPHRLPDSRNPRFFCDLFFGNLCALILMVGQWDRLSRPPIPRVGTRLESARTGVNACACVFGAAFLLYGRVV